MIILFEKKIKKYVLEKKHGANKAENKFKKNSSIIYRYYNNTRSLTKAKSSPMFQFHYYIDSIKKCSPSRNYIPKGDVDKLAQGVGSPLFCSSEGGNKPRFLSPLVSRREKKKNVNICLGIAHTQGGDVVHSRPNKQLTANVLLLNKIQTPSSLRELNNSSFFNFTFDKGRLKNLVSWTLENYGQYKTVELLEQLKKTGFEYATKAGISLGIDDLKIPPKKKTLLLEAEQLTKLTVHQYQRGDITAVERFQRLIDTWHRTSEQLKQEVITYFEETDILNPVYMMAFSGARGNISQVRQLVGMRGLMSDPQGQIIDFPIRSNFREGLTLTEYIISSYGARKGIVDTALRTANAGYLTRRLVDVAQHVIISHYDCGTQKGIFLTDMKEGNKTIVSAQSRIIGRVLARDIYKPNTTIKVASRNQEISTDLAFEITKITNRIFVRSSLTCNTAKLLCQLCYGWSLAQGNLVSVGEAVGVIAAQSIGEPGTQLTMRTFHTGGVFSGDVSDEIRAPYNGYVHYGNTIPGILIRALDGKILFLTKSDGTLIFSTNPILDSSFTVEQISVSPDIKKYKIPAYTVLFIRNGESVFQKQVVAQITSIRTKPNMRDTAELVIKSELEGLFYAKNLQVQKKVIGPKPKFVGEAKQNLLLDAKAMEIIVKARGWNFAWVLSGKRYELPLLLKSFPIIGDFITPQTVITRHNLKLPSSSPKGGHTLKLNITNKAWPILNKIKQSNSNDPYLKNSQKNDCKYVVLHSKTSSLTEFNYTETGPNIFSQSELMNGNWPKALALKRVKKVRLFNLFTKYVPLLLPEANGIAKGNTLVRLPLAKSSFPLWGNRKEKNGKKKNKHFIFEKSKSAIYNNLSPIQTTKIAKYSYNKIKDIINKNTFLLFLPKEENKKPQVLPSVKELYNAKASKQTTIQTIKMKQDLLFLNLQKIKYHKIGYFHFFNAQNLNSNKDSQSMNILFLHRSPKGWQKEEEKKAKAVKFKYNIRYNEVMLSPNSLQSEACLKKSIALKRFKSSNYLLEWFSATTNAFFLPKVNQLTFPFRNQHTQRGGAFFDDNAPFLTGNRRGTTVNYYSFRDFLFCKALFVNTLESIPKQKQPLLAKRFYSLTNNPLASISNQQTLGTYIPKGDASSLVFTSQNFKFILAEKRLKIYKKMYKKPKKIFNKKAQLESLGFNVTNTQHSLPKTYKKNLNQRKLYHKQQTSLQTLVFKIWFKNNKSLWNDFGFLNLKIDSYISNLTKNIYYFVANTLVFPYGKQSTAAILQPYSSNPPKVEVLLGGNINKQKTVINHIDTIKISSSLNKNASHPSCFEKSFFTVNKDELIRTNKKAHTKMYFLDNSTNFNLPEEVSKIGHVSSRPKNFNTLNIAGGLIKKQKQKFSIFEYLKLAQKQPGTKQILKHFKSTSNLLFLRPLWGSNVHPLSEEKGRPLTLVRLPLFRLPLAKTKEEKKSSFCSPFGGKEGERKEKSAKQPLSIPLASIFVPSGDHKINSLKVTQEMLTKHTITEIYYTNIHKNKLVLLNNLLQQIYAQNNNTIKKLSLFNKKFKLTNNHISYICTYYLSSYFRSVCFFQRKKQKETKASPEEGLRGMYLKSKQRSHHSACLFVPFGETCWATHSMKQGPRTIEAMSILFLLKFKEMLYVSYNYLLNFSTKTLKQNRVPFNIKNVNKQTKKRVPKQFVYILINNLKTELCCTNFVGLQSKLNYLAQGDSPKTNKTLLIQSKKEHLNTIPVKEKYNTGEANNFASFKKLTSIWVYKMALEKLTNKHFLGDFLSPGHFILNNILFDKNNINSSFSGSESHLINNNGLWPRNEIALGKVAVLRKMNVSLFTFGKKKAIGKQKQLTPNYQNYVTHSGNKEYKSGKNLFLDKNNVALKLFMKIKSKRGKATCYPLQLQKIDRLFKTEKLKNDLIWIKNKKPRFLPKQLEINFADNHSLDTKKSGHSSIMQQMMVTHKGNTLKGRYAKGEDLFRDTLTLTNGVFVNNFIPLDCILQRRTYSSFLESQRTEYRLTLDDLKHFKKEYELLKTNNPFLYKNIYDIDTIKRNSSQYLFFTKVQEINNIQKLDSTPIANRLKKTLFFNRRGEKVFVNKLAEGVVSSSFPEGEHVINRRTFALGGQTTENNKFLKLAKKNIHFELAKGFDESYKEGMVVSSFGRKQTSGQYFRLKKTLFFNQRGSSIYVPFGDQIKCKEDSAKKFKLYNRLIYIRIKESAKIVPKQKKDVSLLPKNPNFALIINNYDISKKVKKKGCKALKMFKENCSLPPLGEENYSQLKKDPLMSLFEGRKRRTKKIISYIKPPFFDLYFKNPSYSFTYNVSLTQSNNHKVQVRPPSEENNPLCSENEGEQSNILVRAYPLGMIPQKGSSICNHQSLPLLGLKIKKDTTKKITIIPKQPCLNICFYSKYSSQQSSSFFSHSFNSKKSLPRSKLVNPQQYLLGFKWNHFYGTNTSFLNLINRGAQLVSRTSFNHYNGNIVARTNYLSPFEGELLYTKPYKNYLELNPYQNLKTGLMHLNNLTNHKTKEEKMRMAMFKYYLKTINKAINVPVGDNDLSQKAWSRFNLLLTKKDLMTLNYDQNFEKNKTVFSDIQKINQCLNISYIGTTRLINTLETVITDSKSSSRDNDIKTKVSYSQACVNNLFQTYIKNKLKIQTISQLNKENHFNKAYNFNLKNKWLKQNLSYCYSSINHKHSLIRPRTFDNSGDVKLKINNASLYSTKVYKIKIIINSSALKKSSTLLYRSDLNAIPFEDKHQKTKFDGAFQQSKLATSPKGGKEAEESPSVYPPLAGELLNYLIEVDKKETTKQFLYIPYNSNLNLKWLNFKQKNVFTKNKVGFFFLKGNTFFNTSTKLTTNKIFLNAKMYDLNTKTSFAFGQVNFLQDTRHLDLNICLEFQKLHLNHNFLKLKPLLDKLTFTSKMVTTDYQLSKALLSPKGKEENQRNSSLINRYDISKRRKNLVAKYNLRPLWLKNNVFLRTKPSIALGQLTFYPWLNYTLKFVPKGKQLPFYKKQLYYTLYKSQQLSFLNIIRLMPNISKEILSLPFPQGDPLTFPSVDVDSLLSLLGKQRRVPLWGKKDLFYFLKPINTSTSLYVHQEIFACNYRKQEHKFAASPLVKKQRFFKNKNLYVFFINLLKTFINTKNNDESLSGKLGNRLSPSFLSPDPKQNKIQVIKKSGQLIHMNKQKITLRLGQPLVISSRSIIHASHGDFIRYKTSVITLTYQQLKTGDIVQGIPKIEQLFEARTTKRGRLFRDNVTNLLTGLFLKYFVKSTYLLRKNMLDISKKTNPQNLQTKQTLYNNLSSLKQITKPNKFANYSQFVNNKQNQTIILALALQWSVKQSFYKIQQIIVDGILRVYRSQGVSIADKHVEIIVKQMTSKVRIINSNASKLTDYSFSLQNINRGLRAEVTKQKVPSQLKTNQAILGKRINGTKRAKTSQAFENKLLEQLLSNNLDGPTGLFPGEIVDIDFVENINNFLLKTSSLESLNTQSHTTFAIEPIKYEPIVLGITRASLEVESFLSAASFQQTTRVLSQAALYKKKDFLKGLKENIIIGNLIPAGTGYLSSLNL
uniref:DNA-directed RNA polymerase n=1 Tax=Yamagishiella unicocca TaxID=51707 RepID=A0A6C0RX15_9CHLO|nr:beta' subunit of RNA polymerase [Yamagishiella unicocca]